MAPRVTLRRERALLAAGARTVAGVDEVGRGALAGPVSVGAVVVSGSTPPAPRGLADSKQLPPPVREALVAPLRAWAVGWGVGHASAAEIDRFGLTRALRFAGQRALAAATGDAIEIDVVLLDGSFDWLSPTRSRVVTEIKADGRCSSVAAASVLAKVERDAALVALAEQYPHYGFDRHKGYAVPDHLAALRQHGACPVHRQTWRLGIAA